MQLSLSENIKIFNNAEFGEIRVMLIDDDPWFVGKDVAEVLGYSNPQKAVRDHCKAPSAVGVNDSFTLPKPSTVTGFLQWSLTAF